MERQLVRLVTVLMNKSVEGIPDGHGGYLEKPIETEARKYVEECGGELDAAVAAGAYEILLRKDKHWTESVWKGALLVVVGQIPVVGTTASVFCAQFESIWRQLRFVTLAATIYGLNPNDEAVKCQIVLCLLDDKVRRTNGQNAMEMIYSKGVKSGIEVAVSIIARHIIARGGTGFLMKRVLGGLLAGVVPETVGLLYTVLWSKTGLSSEAELASRTKELTERAKQHFKKEEKPSMTLVYVSFIVWIIPTLILNVSKVWTIYDKVIDRILNLRPALDNANSLLLDELSLPFQHTVGSFAGSQIPSFFKTGMLVVILFCVVRLIFHFLRLHTWFVTSTTLILRAFLNALAAKGTAESLGFAILLWNSPDRDCHEQLLWYYAHKAAVGLYMIASRRKKELKQFIPLACGSLFIWVMFNIGWARWKETLSTLQAISLHMFLDQIRRPDIIMTAVGPRKVVDGLFFAAKSLGNVVASPDSVLFWLDQATPPFILSSVIFSLQTCASTLGFTCQLLYQFHFASLRELTLLSYAVFITVPFVMWEQSLPPPHDEYVWSQALRARHRLLYLVPELDNTVQSRLFFAVKFFEQYDIALSSSKKYASSQFVRVKEWVATSFSKRERQEFERIKDGEVEFDYAVYQMSWWDTVKYKLGMAHAQLVDGTNTEQKQEQDRNVTKDTPKEEAAIVKPEEEEEEEEELKAAPAEKEKLDEQELDLDKSSDASDSSTSPRWYHRFYSSSESSDKPVLVEHPHEDDEKTVQEKDKELSQEMRPEDDQRWYHRFYSSSNVQEEEQKPSPPQQQQGDEMEGDRWYHRFYSSENYTGPEVETTDIIEQKRWYHRWYSSENPASPDTTSNEVERDEVIVTEQRWYHRFVSSSKENQTQEIEPIENANSGTRWYHQFISKPETAEVELKPHVSENEMPTSTQTM